MPKAAPKPEESWRPARLIPTTGIGGQDEQEQRATSSLLAVIQAVPQFGRAVLRHVDAPTGKLTTYTEIRFQGFRAAWPVIHDASAAAARGAAVEALVAAAVADHDRAAFGAAGG